jgi:cyanate permease
VTLACDDEQIQAHEAGILLDLRQLVKMTSMILLPVVMSRFRLTNMYVIVWFLILFVYFLLRCSTAVSAGVWICLMCLPKRGKSRKIMFLYVKQSKLT